MLPICYYRKCGKPSEVNVGKLDVEDGDIEGEHWLTSVYLCKKHAKKLAKELGLALHIEEASKGMSRYMNDRGDKLCGGEE